MYTKDKDKDIHFRISEEDYNKLKQKADEYNLSVSLFVRNLLVLYLVKEKNEYLQTDINSNI